MTRIASFPVSRGYRNSSSSSNTNTGTINGDEGAVAGLVDGGGTTVANGTLSKLPKPLYVLWNEWEFGVGGNKPAILFSATERGRLKH